jgi:hypothetical protein
MNSKMRMALLAGVVVAAAAVAGAIVVGMDEKPVSTEPMTADPCCFTNPRFSGTCKVVPGEGESCSSILGYLNNPNSSGKAYCGGTTIRGGWTQVTCE